MEQTLTLDLGKGVKLELVLIPPGKFLMGSPANEEGRSDNEGPQHEVTISQAFYMGKYAVTQAQYEAVMGYNRSHCRESVGFLGLGGKKTVANLPVENVSWDNTQDFCRKLREETGKRVRLPTEAEWEYACRAGTRGLFYSGDNEGNLASVAWYRDNSGNTTHPVGQNGANAWGLCDMHGNVWEQCGDWYGPYAAGVCTDPTGPANGADRVLRGGAWHCSPPFCRSAYRFYPLPFVGLYGHGFRVVLLPVIV